jgi:hypothetical protein
MLQSHAYKPGYQDVTNTDIVSVDTGQRDEERIREAKSRGERNSNRLVLTLECVDTTKLDCMGQWMI